MSKYPWFISSEDNLLALQAQSVHKHYAYGGDSMKTDTTEDALYIAMLYQISGIGPQSILRIITSFPSADLFHQASSTELTEKLGEKLASTLSLHPEEWSRLREIVRNTFYETAAQDIVTIPLNSPLYPPLLKLIHTPPVLLYAKGDIDLLQQTKSVAIVGTRNPTQKGREMAFSLAQRWVTYDYVIVSGLAKGIDAEAHRGAIDVKGKTIAVMGTPLDKIYPAENKDLAQRILDTGGLWLSEIGLGQASSKNAFVQRDRLQSGLSLCVFPVQTTRDGGTMHAIRFADEQKRYVICLQPPSSEEHEKQYDGVWYLLREKKKACLDITKIEHYERCLQRFAQLEQKLSQEERTGARKRIGTTSVQSVDTEVSGLWVTPTAVQSPQGKGSIGKVIGNYLITEKMAGGSHGHSYRAEHTSVVRRPVVIKFLNVSLEKEKERDQFAQAAEEFLFKLKHPYILPMLDFDFIKHQPYVISPYLTAGSLRNLLKQQPRLPFNQALAILSQVGQALHYAHQHNIVHGNLKPENILFDKAGDVLLADFRGIFSYQTGKQDFLPTDLPYYMAPEQFNRDTTKESDQYGLGCLAYELVTGRPPFTATGFQLMGSKHRIEQPVPPTHYNPQVTGDVERAILRALAKEKAERYSDIPAFLVALHDPQEIDRRRLEMLLTPSPWITQLGRDFFKPRQGKWWPEGKEEHSIEVFIADVEHSMEAFLDARAAMTSEQDAAHFYNAKGLALYNLRRYEEALATFEQVIHIDSTVADAYNNQGKTLYKLRRYEEALSAYERAIQIDPHSTDAYTNKSIILCEMQRYDEALAATRQVLHLSLSQAREYYDQGQSFYHFQRYREAFDSYEKALMLASEILNEYEVESQHTLRRLAEDRAPYASNEDHPIVVNNI